MLLFGQMKNKYNYYIYLKIYKWENKNWSLLSRKHYDLKNVKRTTKWQTLKNK